MDESNRDLPAAPTGSSRAAHLRRLRSGLRDRRSWPIIGGMAVAVAIALVAGTLAWTSDRDDPRTRVATASPSAPPADPSPEGSDDAGEPGLAPGRPLSASDWTPTAELTADDAPGGVVDLASGFRLTSLDATPAATLAARLAIDPPIEVDVTSSDDGRTAQLDPVEPLATGALYRFTLTTDDGRPLQTWAFQSHRPLRIVATTPGDAANEVPLDTGIEILFDQDGVVDAADHVDIEPAVKGRFEQHGRVLSFIPSAALRPATIYTVTVSAGVTVSSTDERLEADVRFRFETAAPAGDKPIAYRFTDDLFETRPSEAPTIALWASQDWEGDEEPEPPSRAPVEVYRFPDMPAAIDAFRVIRDAPGWAQWSTPGLVSTSGLRRVAAFEAELQESQGVLWFRTPERLPLGEYLVHLADPVRPVQTVLQVTDIAAYLAVSETSTLVWANDLRSGGPLAGAIVRAEGKELGRTTADGSLLATSPGALLAPSRGDCPAPCAPVVVVEADGQSILLPATGSRDGSGKDGEFGFFGDSSDYWSVFETDRTLYSRKDTIGAYGLVRDRDSGAVPEDVSVRLFHQDTWGDGPALARVAVRPDARGAYSTAIRLDDVPAATYRLQVWVGREVIDELWVRVDRVRKPAYRLEVVTGRRVYIQGDRVRVTARASFYEGSPVPNLPLQLDGIVEGRGVTDATGTAIVRGIAQLESERDEEPTHRTAQARPGRAEEGEIVGASPYVLIFPSGYVIDASARLADGRIVVDGSVHELDRDRLEREIAAQGETWGLDPAGPGVAGASVTAAFDEVITNRVQRGTEYDFILKKAVPVWEYETTERDAGTIKVRTDRDGRFTAEMEAPGPGRSFVVRMAVRDPDGYTARRTTDVQDPAAAEREVEGAVLRPTSDRSTDDYGLGDTLDLTMVDPSTPASTTDRYLFLTAQRGLRDAAIQTSPRYRTTVGPWLAPNAHLLAVRFTGERFVIGTSFSPQFRVAERELQVDLSTDAARYAPGDQVTLTVTTRDAKGERIPATVVLRAVDEKLFALDGARLADPLQRLYAWVPSGIQATYRSHRVPTEEFGGGDTGGGGGDRADFRDVLLFRSVETGGDGRATITFDLSDDLTSWHVSAAAFGADLQAGASHIAVPVGLPFFVDATIAPEYLVSDRPTIAVRAFGSALEDDEPVTFAVRSDSLGLRVDGLRGEAFQAVAVPLPTLTAGEHRITITAIIGSGDARRTDRLTRTISVVTSRLVGSRTRYEELRGPTRLTVRDGLHEVVVAAGGSAAYAPLLMDVAGRDSARLEDALAAALADALLERWFSDAGRSQADASFDGATYQLADGGLAILPYSSSDLEVSSLAALIAPDRFDGSRLTSYFETIVAAETETRERRAYALAGLAGLGVPALPRLRVAAADPDLTIRERLILGLGAAAIGDGALAHDLARGLVDDAGESVDADAARLRVSDSPTDVTAATALMALLAAELGDPLAARFWRYVEANPSRQLTTNLPGVGVAAAALERAAPVAGSFAYELDGERKVVELEPGGSFRMVVTAAQARSIVLEPVDGEVSVTSTWSERLDVDGLAAEPGLSITRSMAPAAVTPGELVVVDLTVVLPPDAPTGCYPVTEVVPSGLVPVGSLFEVYDPDDGAEPPSRVAPYAQVDQQVSFCATTEPSGGRLRYVARVVTSGTYTWEPTVVTGRTGPDRGASTGSSVVVID
jgi:hypothetical protein